MTVKQPETNRKKVIKKMRRDQNRLMSPMPEGEILRFNKNYIS
jgi:hypothetical protein